MLLDDRAAVPATLCLSRATPWGVAADALPLPPSPARPSSAAVRPPLLCKLLRNPRRIRNPRRVSWRVRMTKANVKASVMLAIDRAITALPRLARRIQARALPWHNLDALLRPPAAPPSPPAPPPAPFAQTLKYAPLCQNSVFYSTQCNLSALAIGLIVGAACIGGIVTLILVVIACKCALSDKAAAAPKAASAATPAASGRASACSTTQRMTAAST